VAVVAREPMTRSRVLSEISRSVDFQLKNTQSCLRVVLFLNTGQFNAGWMQFLFSVFIVATQPLAQKNCLANKHIKVLSV